MGSLTTKARNAALKKLTMDTTDTYTPQTTLYLALCTGDPGVGATGAACNECSNSGNSYARAALTFGVAAAARAIANSAITTFTQLTGSAGNASHFAICDSGTYAAGNVLAFGQFTETKALVSGNTPTVASGEISISIASGVLSDYAVHKLLDWMFRNQTFTVTANALGLATGTISNDTTGITVTEVADSSFYGRLAINAQGGLQPSWAAVGTDNAVANANQWTFATPNGSWGLVVASFIADSPQHSNVGLSQGGNILIYDNGITDQTVSIDDVVYYATGQFSLTVD